MEIVKKNIISIICGVIALAAIISLFWPIGGMYSKSQLELNTGKTLYDKAQTLLRTQRLLPVMPAVSDTPPPPEPLKVFPGPKVIEAGEVARDEVKKQSDDLKNQAINANKHALVFDALPNPGDKVFDFRKAYLKVVDPSDTLDPNATPPDKNHIPLRRILSAGTPPVQKDIDDAAKQLHDTKYEPTIYYIGGQEANRQQVEANFKREAADLPQRLRQERAQQCKLYMAPDAIGVNPNLIDQTKTPTPGQLWYAQMALWVKQDVAQAIADANADAKDVIDAPVKRIGKLDVPEDAQIYFGGSTGPAAAAVTPGPGDKDFTRSPTGRLSNTLYDVVHFSLVLTIDATRLPLVLEKLEQGKLITVYQVDLSSVDSRAALDDGYVFGKSPVVRVTLQCESLFLRQWTTVWMPQEIQDLLHIPKATDSSL